MGALGDAVDWAIENSVGKIVDAISNGIFEPVLNFLFQYLTGTPHPDNIYSFNAPTNDPWPVFYDIFHLRVQILIPSLFTLFLAIGFIFNILKPKQKKTTIRRAIFAFPIAISWWWLAGWFLMFNDYLAAFIMQGATEQLTNNFSSLITTAGAAVFVSLGLYVVGLPIVLGVAMIYFIRRIAIFMYMVGMPILLMFWVVPISQVQGWAKKMMGYFPALVLVTLPTSLLLRVGTELLGSQTGVTGAVMGFSVLLLAGIVPKYMLNFSSAVGSAVRKGSMTGRAAAAGAAGAGAGGGGRPSRGGGGRGGGTTAAGGGGGRSAAAGGGGGGGGEDGSVNDQHGRQTPMDYSPQMSRRRRQRERAQKVGAGARRAASSAREKAGSAAQSAGQSAVASAASNYYGEGNTVAGMAKDAGGAIKDAAGRARKAPAEKVKKVGEMNNKRMSKVDRRVRSRRAELKQKYGPGEDGFQKLETSNQTGEFSPYRPYRHNPDSEPGGVQADEEGGREGPASDQSRSGRVTYDRNQSSRETGSIGQSGRQTYDRNKTGRETGSFGSSNSDGSGSDDGGRNLFNSDSDERDTSRE